MFENKKLEKFLVLVLIFAALSFFKVMFTVGAKNFSIPAYTPLLPLLPAFTGTVTATILIIFRALTKTLWKGTLVGIILSMHIPTILATIYFSKFRRPQEKNSLTKKVFLIGYPILCIILFCIHPVGRKAFIYSIFWLIPIFISIRKNKTIFLASLATTFVAHATGSIIWLYLGLIDEPKIWLSLIPIVILERITFTFQMTFCFCAVNYTGKSFGSCINNLKNRLAVRFNKQKGNYDKKNSSASHSCKFNPNLNTFV